MDEPVVRKLAAIMFTDIEGYTAFVQKDEKAALQKVAVHRKFLEEFTTQYDGKVIAFYGDGSLSIYNSALDAVRCGIAMQKAYQGDHPIPVRIGIHVGDIVFKDETVYGDGVNISSRLQASGIPGSIYISDRVRAEITNHPDITTTFLGRKKLKNVKEAVGVYAITNEGVQVPSGMTKLPELSKFYRYAPILLIAALAVWFLNSPLKDKLLNENYTTEAISVPVFKNFTGDPSLDFIAQMGAHWITKELSSTEQTKVVSYESASEMLEMAGLSIDSPRGRKRYASLTGAVDMVDASYSRLGSDKDSLRMTAFIKSLSNARTIKAFEDVTCKTNSPMDCIEQLSGDIKGFLVSRDAKLLKAPNYEAYKAFLLAKGAWREGDPEYVRAQLDKAIRNDPDFIDSYFLLLDLFYNEGKPQEAYDTIQAMKVRFTDLNARQKNMLEYHEADVEGHNDEAYAFFLKEYEKDPKDLFTNNSAIVMAMMYRHNPNEALKFFNEIPYDSIQTEGCTYCGERFEMAMWAALDAGDMELADILATKIYQALNTRKSFGTLVMYHVWKNDTAMINQVITDSRRHPDYDQYWEYLNYLAGRLFLVREQPEIASIYFKKGIERWKGSEDRMLGKCYYFDNQLDLALAHHKMVLEKRPTSDITLIEIGMIYARQGNVQEATKVIEQLESRRITFDYGYIEYHQGRIYALLGEKEKAIELIGIAIGKGCKYDLWITFDHDPDIMTLRDHPEYIRIMRQFQD